MLQPPLLPELRLPPLSTKDFSCVGTICGNHDCANAPQPEAEYLPGENTVRELHRESSVRPVDGASSFRRREGAGESEIFKDLSHELQRTGSKASQASSIRTPRRLTAAAVQAFLSAAACGDVAMCTSLLGSWPGEPGELLEACNRDRQTALILASKNGHVQVCQFLLGSRADVEATDIRHRTPLSYAAAAEHAEICSLLLDYGADVEATDCVVRDMGCTAM